MESPNLVITSVRKISQMFLKPFFCEVIFTIFSDFFFNNCCEFECDKKLGENFTKFCENFRESPNLVINMVRIFSQFFWKLFFLKYFSPYFVIFSSNFLVIFEVPKKRSKYSPYWVKILWNHQIWWNMLRRIFLGI